MSRLIVSVMIVLGLTSCTECVGVKDVAATAVIDCAELNQDAIAAVVLEFRTLLQGSLPDWPAVGERALRAGRLVGGCALARIVDELVLPGAALAPPAAALVVTRGEGCATLQRVEQRFQARYLVGGKLAAEACHGS